MCDIIAMAMDDQEAQHMLTRIDERTQTLVDGFAEFKKEVSNKFVTNDRFTPIERGFYGLAGLVGTAFIAGLITVLLRF